MSSVIFLIAFILISAIVIAIVARLERKMKYRAAWAVYVSSSAAAVLAYPIFQFVTDFIL